MLATIAYIAGTDVERCLALPYITTFQLWR
jgi:hypothetical protein